MTEVTFKAFIDEFQNNLNPSSCIPTCLEEICGGCKTVHSLFIVFLIQKLRVARNL